MRFQIPARPSVSLTFFLLLSFLFVTASSTTAHAQGIKARMLARLPQIDSMKSSGILGENNKGFLEFVGKTREDQDVVEAENLDRQKVYEAIAAKEGTSPDLVGRRRALQIAENAVAGTWLQAQDGSWYKK